MTRDSRQADGVTRFVMRYDDLLEFVQMSSDAAISSLAPMLSVRRGAQAVEFYKKAFGASELFRIESPAGEVVAELSIQGGKFWVADESPAHANFSPESLNGSTSRFVIVTPDPQRLHAQALAAGAKQIWPVREENGWLIGRVVDPFGHHWEIGRPLGPGVGE